MADGDGGSGWEIGANGRERVEYFSGWSDGKNYHAGIDGIVRIVRGLQARDDLGKRLEAGPISPGTTINIKVEGRKMGFPDGKELRVFDSYEALNAEYAAFINPLIEKAEAERNI